MEKEIDLGKDLEQVSFSSFELKQTSKGVNIKVKIYTSDAVEALERSQKECERRFDELRKKYGQNE